MSRIASRRSWTLRLVAGFAGTALALLAAGTSPTADGAPARGVLTVGYTVSDLDRTVAFFRDVLTFTVVGERESSGRPFELLEGVFGAHVRIATLALGSERLELTQYLAPEGRLVPSDARSNDRDFQHVAVIVSDMDEAYGRLRSFRVRHASSSPQTLPATIPAAAGIRAFYFKDPDGHFLEILQFPPDKGPARWHARDRLFLGLDHTAIVVADTEASLRVYRDALGLAVAGTSENFGTEQEHLNNVFGAHLRITTLRATDGPGIELLEYLAPTTGRSALPDLRANDLQHWETTIDVTDVASATNGLVRAGARRVSPGPVTLDGESSPFSEGALVRDTDGHAIRVVRGATAGRATN